MSFPVYTINQLISLHNEKKVFVRINGETSKTYENKKNCGKTLPYPPDFNS